MREKVLKMMSIMLSIILFLSACGTTGTEGAHTTTAALTTAEVTTEEIESTEQAEAPSYDFTYEAVYSGNWGAKEVDSDGFLLVTSREEIDNFVKLDSQSNEKYSSEWFETHALICGVLVLRDVMSGKTTEMELEFFSLAGEDLGY